MNQSRTVGRELVTAFKVYALDIDNNGISGVGVVFEAVNSGLTGNAYIKPDMNNDKYSEIVTTKKF